MCPVCGKKVGAWHPGGVHPKCRKQESVATSGQCIRHGYGTTVCCALWEKPNAQPFLAPAIQRMTQAQRDVILRRISTKKERA